MHEGSSGVPMRMSAEKALANAADGLFQEPPLGHFWLEHLVKTLASQRLTSDATPWRLVGVPSRDGAISALYGVNVDTGYAMLHSVDPEPAATLLRWALSHQPPQKVLAPYLLLQRAIDIAGLSESVYRDHRELCLQLSLGDLAVPPDWDYRLATYADIPRLKEYNRIYNEERQTNWSRNWDHAIANRAVYVRERDERVSSCLLRGALLAPWVSFGGVFTFPEFRGLGEATMLVANYCAEMSLSGLNVCLIVDDDNTPALKAYTKVGFTPSALYRTTYFKAL